MVIFTYWPKSKLSMSRLNPWLRVGMKRQFRTENLLERCILKVFIMFLNVVWDGRNGLASILSVALESFE